MSKNNGGPAFPVSDTYHPNGQVEYGSPGMTLRDHFAAKAPVSFADAVAASGLHAHAPDLSMAVARVWVSDEDRRIVFSILAMLRGEYADAMLAEREK